MLALVNTFGLNVKIMNMVIKLYVNGVSLTSFLRGEKTLTACPQKTSHYDTEIQIDPSEFDIEANGQTLESLFHIQKKRQVL